MRRDLSLSLRYYSLFVRQRRHHYFQTDRLGFRLRALMSQAYRYRMRHHHRWAFRRRYYYRKSHRSYHWNHRRIRLSQRSRHWRNCWMSYWKSDFPRNHLTLSCLATAWRPKA